MLALLGGGTMNVTSRWLGFGSSPGQNFRHVVSAFRSGDLLLKEVPLMRVKVGNKVHHGFTFGIGPVVRILDAYERGEKGKVAALKIGLQSAVAAFLKLGSAKEMLDMMPATVTLDDEVLPYESFSAVFSNVTGQINPGIEPFKSERTRDSFHTACYSISAREFAIALPFIARGLIPVDLAGMLRKWGSGKLAEPLDSDPRYVNRSASRMLIETNEPIYTVDGEILQKPEGPIEVTIGPTLKLAVGPKANLGQALQAARNAIRG